MTGLPVVVALADTKFESWLRASAETLRLEGFRYSRHGDPEDEIRRCLGSKKYVKPTWQPRFTQRMDLAIAVRRSSSLAQLEARFAALVKGLD